MSLLPDMLTRAVGAARAVAASINSWGEPEIEPQHAPGVGVRVPVTAVFEITVFNTATQVATEYAVEADTEAAAVASLDRELQSRAACAVPFEHTSFFCGHPRCLAAH